MSFQLTFTRVLTSKQDFPLGQGKSGNLLKGQVKSGESDIFTSKSVLSQGRIFCELKNFIISNYLFFSDKVHLNIRLWLF